jgi:hypothetical protein
MTDDSRVNETMMLIAELEDTIEKGDLRTVEKAMRRLMIHQAEHVVRHANGILDAEARRAMLIDTARRATGKSKGTVRCP